MGVSLADVKKLKELTGVGLGDAKNALVEADGDFDKALEEMRKKGLTKAEKKGDRETREGVIGNYNHDGRIGVLVEVNCETDFVAKDESFLAFAQAAAQAVVAGNPADVAALGDVKTADGQTVEAVRKAVIAKLGENISVRRFERIETANNLTAYIHGAAAGEGVLVEFKGAEDVARKVGMHIVAAKPQCVSADQVDQELIEKERHIYTEQANASGKPAEIVAKMVDGRINKYLAEITLNGQAFVMNPDQTVAQFLKENNAEVVHFVRYKVGDGIEKAVVDYAAEVAAAAKV